MTNWLHWQTTNQAGTTSVRTTLLAAIRAIPGRWHPGIALKLWLAFMLVVVLLVATLLGLLQWRLGSSFQNYLQQADLARLDALSARLTNGYARHGNWRWLQNNPAAWRQLLDSHGLRSQRPRPPRPPPRRAERRPPPPPPLEGLDLRLGLLDPSGLLLQGQAPGNSAERLRLHHDGELVGWLSIAPRRLSDDRLALNFLTRQTQFFYLSGAVALLLASLAAGLLARHLLEPMKVLTAGTRALTRGCYTTRIGLQRRDELGLLAADFDRLAATLEDNERARRQWMADISHELRTPLAVLRGELEALEEGIRSWNTAALASLQTEVGRLHRLVDDLHELARSELGGLAYRKQRIDLVSRLQTLLDSHVERLYRAGIRLEACLPEQSLMLFADPQRLDQLFANLLNNTLAYTNPEGVLRVSCNQQGNWITVDFQDSSPGVPTEALPRLFDRLYRVESSRNRALGGSGLGLAICENIVLAHDGQIQARPSPLGGLWIQLRLPGESIARE